MQYMSYMHSVSKTIRLLLLSLALTLTVHPALAEWHTAFGSAAIINDDVAAARQAAINDALENIMLENGMPAPEQQDSSSGLFSEPRINVQSNSPVRKVTVLEEERTLSSVSVKVRAFIDEKRINPCPMSAVRKSVLPLIFRFADNQAYQSAAGLEDLPAEVGHKIFADLGQSPYLRLLPPANFRFFVHSESSGPSYEELAALEQIADHYQTQFLLVGTLRSAAPSESGDNFLENIIYKRTRTIDFNLVLYHALSGAVVFKQNYRAETDWDFKQGEYVDLRSHRFQSSAYGERLSQLCQDAALDVINALSCLPPAASIIAIEGDDVLINLGSTDGLKEGLIFRVSHQSENYDRSQRRFRSFERSTAMYKVSAVFPETARLSPVSLNEAPLHVMLDDLVILER